MQAISYTVKLISTILNCILASRVHFVVTWSIRTLTSTNVWNCPAVIIIFGKREWNKLDFILFFCRDSPRQFWTELSSLSSSSSSSLFQAARPISQYIHKKNTEHRKTIFKKHEKVKMTKNIIIKNKIKLKRESKKLETQSILHISNKIKYNNVLTATQLSYTSRTLWRWARWPIILLWILQTFQEFDRIMELLCNIVSNLGRRSSNNIFVTLSDRSLISKEHFHTFIVTRHLFTFSSNIVLTPQSSIINTYTIGFKRNTFDIHRNNDFDFMNSSDLDLGSNQYIKFHIKIYPVVFLVILLIHSQTEEQRNSHG